MTINTDNVDKVEKLLQNVFNETVVLIQNKKWVYIKNKDVYFNNDTVSLFPNLTTFKLGFYPSSQLKYNPQTFISEFNGFKGDIMTLAEFKKAFSNNGREYFVKKLKWNLGNYFTVKFENQFKYAILDIKQNIPSTNPYNIYNIPIFRLNEQDSKPFDKKYIVEFFLAYGLMPDGLKAQTEKLYTTLIEFYHKKYITVTDGILKITEELLNNEATPNPQPKPDTTQPKVNPDLTQPNSAQEEVKAEADIPSSQEEIKAQIPPLQEEIKAEAETPSSQEEIKTEAEIPTSQEEIKTEVETPTSQEEIKTEVETPTSQEEIKTEVETPTSQEEIKTEVETPTSQEEIKTEVETPTSQEEIKAETVTHPSQEEIKAQIPPLQEEIKAEAETPSSQEEIKTETEIPTSQEEIKTEVETPTSQEEIKTEVETPTSQEEIKTEVETPTSQEEIKTEVETPTSQEEIKTEVETPTSQEEIKAETVTHPSQEEIKAEIPPSQEKIKTEAEIPTSQEEIKAEVLPSQEEVKTEAEIPAIQEEIKAEAEIPTSQEEIKAEAEISPTQEEIKTEVETPTSQEEIKAEAEISPSQEEAKAEAEIPTSQEEIKTETEIPTSQEEIKTETEIPSIQEEPKTESEIPSTSEEIKVEAEEIQNSVESENLSELDKLKQKLLTCDNLRCDLEVYKEKILTDINRGHWDLWEEYGDDTSDTIITSDKLVARNPKLDIRYDSTIAIDFGTKSTIVVSQKNNKDIMPIRIGTGHLNKKLEATDYENPTVIELRDLDKFLEKYNEKDGRPETLWDTLTTSHTAAKSLFESNASEEFYAHLNDLKQWARDKRRKLKLKDKTGKYISLPIFSELKKDDFDPIEVYAYYIGSYINNMHNGNNIYLDYILSFPVTFEEDIQNKIVESFSKGLKKSLPVSILKDTEIMNNFRVSIGASEPVAYAICALEQYGFEPENDQKIFYGVFDFGGGTTDFDFGIWREADEYEDRYDYIVEHLNSGGDEYLGGENLLELLAFEVFKSNQDKLRQDGITFILPYECKSFEGSEILLEDTQEARLNMVQLAEKLRPLWEQQDGYETSFKDDKIKVDLFNNVGKRKVDYELDVKMNELQTIIEARIEKGVRNFFEGLNVAFKKLDFNTVDCVNIFLAGNSSKSPVVKSLFNKYIEAEVDNIFKGKDKDKNQLFKMLFKVFPLLGTKEAYDLQESLGVKVERNSITNPTGKTGVAFGLIMSRPGSNIKIINQSDKIFNYYIGHNKKKKFIVVSDTQVKYEKWIRFIDASASDFTLYYTSLAEASTNKLDIKETNMKKCRINEIDKDANVYYRIVEPTVIEYTVAKPEDIENEDYLGEITRLELD